MRAGFDEIACLYRLRRVLCHNEFRKKTENSIFDASAKRESPPLAQAFIHIDDFLVEIVRLIDDGQRVH